MNILPDTGTCAPAPGAARLQSLRQRLLRIDRHVLPVHGRVPTGHPGIDAALGGGLPRGRLHALAAAAEDAGAAMGLAAGLATLLAAGRPLLWVRVPGRAACGQGAAMRLSGHGLLAQGGDPAALLLLHAPDAATAARVAEDGARLAAIGAVVLELPGAVRLPQQMVGRRLQLAAGQSGVAVLLLALGAGDLAAGLAAETRWRVATAASRPLAAAAPGRPAMRLELQHQRGRPAGQCWRVEWNPDARCLDETPLPGAGDALPADRSLAPRAGQGGGQRIAAA